MLLTHHIMSQNYSDAPSVHPVVCVTLSKLFHLSFPQLQASVHLDPLPLKWEESINKGEGLVIVDVPSKSQPVPLWELLPNKKDGLKSPKK